MYPFTETQQVIIAPPGCLPLRSRSFSLVDVPDLLSAKSVVSDIDSVWFGAAPVPAFYHMIFRSLARGVKVGMLKSLQFIAPLMYQVMRHFAWGKHRGGMFVSVSGCSADDIRVSRSWHLVAEGDDGPAIPAMAAAAIVMRYRDGNHPQPGARPATEALELDDFRGFFRKMKIREGVWQTASRGDAAELPLFQRMLGDAWHDLPAEIIQVHEVSGTATFRGAARVTRGKSILARLLGRIIGFPPAGQDIPLKVDMRVADGRERWTRDFDGHAFSSEMSAGENRLSGLLRERFGIARFALALVWETDSLKYVPRGWTLLGLPMPLWLAPQGKMLEYVADQRFHFHVEIKAPIIGDIVIYQGWLQPAD